MSRGSKILSIGFLFITFFIIGAHSAQAATASGSCTSSCSPDHIYASPGNYFEPVTLELQTSQATASGSYCVEGGPGGPQCESFSLSPGQSSWTRPGGTGYTHAWITNLNLQKGSPNGYVLWSLTGTEICGGGSECGSELNSYHVNVNVGGDGNGRVVASGGGIDCNNGGPGGTTQGTCDANYPDYSEVVLNVIPGSGSTFWFWTGDCSGQATPCRMSGTGDRAVGAYFTVLGPGGQPPPPPPPGGGGGGGVCGSNEGDRITPGTATVQVGQTYDFGAIKDGEPFGNMSSWSSSNTNVAYLVYGVGQTGRFLGAGPGTTCITGWGGGGFAPATFIVTPAPPPPPVTHTLSVGFSAGSGTITGTGISCPGDCSETFNEGTTLTLTATPATDYVFSGWTGYCADSGASCSITMNSAVSTSASFTYQAPFNYSLSDSGNISVVKGNGNVSTQNTITKTLLAGTAQAVSLSVAGVPSNVSYSVASGSCSPSCTSVITFTVAPTAVSGTYPITVTGSPLNRPTTFNLIIIANSMSVSCSANPTSILLGQDVTWSATITGGTPPRTLVWAGTNIPVSPAPSSTPYTKNYSTIGAKVATLSVTDSTGLGATCAPVTIYVNFDPDFEEF